MPLDAAQAVLEDVRASLDGVPARLGWTENMAVPSVWIHADNTTPANNVQRRSVLTVDIWTRSRGHADELLSALDWLHRHAVKESGSSRGLMYSLESVNVVDEAANVVHAAMLLSVLHMHVPSEATEAPSG